MKAKSTVYKTFDPLVGLATAVIYFLTVYEHIPKIVYSIIALIVALYFFPIKLFLFSQKETEQKWTFIHAISDPLFSLIFAFSVVNLFAADGDNIFSFAISIVAIVNGLLIWYHYFSGSSKYYIATHFCLGFLTAGMILG